MSARDDDLALRLELNRVRAVLATLIAWLPQSANAPLTRDEARRLQRIMDGHAAPTVTGRYLQRFPPEVDEP